MVEAKTNLTMFRKQKGYSLEEMARTMGISKSYYEKVEYGERTPSYNFIVKFKKAFPDAITSQIFLL